MVDEAIGFGELRADGAVEVVVVLMVGRGLGRAAAEVADDDTDDGARRAAVGLFKAEGTYDVDDAPV